MPPTRSTSISGSSPSISSPPIEREGGGIADRGLRIDRGKLRNPQAAIVLMSPTRDTRHPTPSAVIAIDPGRSKCGVAAVDSASAVLHRAVVPTADLPAALRDLVERLRPDAIL